MITIQNKTDCCGCTACANICPKNCITMEPDVEGFLYPKINNDLCVNCGLCEKVCPVMHPPILKDGLQNLTACVARILDDAILQKSTSGGAISAISRYVLQSGGYVCGCVLNKNFLTEHRLIESEQELNALCGSKYVQSSLDTCFIQIEKLLKKDKKVCFIGTPCQVAGLKNFLRKDYDNLLTIDLVCRSIPSLELYKKYLSYQEYKYQSKVRSINFRNKTYGYHSGTLTIEFENGKKYSGSNRVDLFMKTFHNNIASRPSCYKCKFKTRDRCSDFTMFDSWKPEKIVKVPLNDDDKGYTNVILHSEKAKNIINQLDNIKIYPADIDKIFLYAGSMESESIQRPKNRQSFFNGLKEVSDSSFEKYIKSYISVTKKDLFLEKTKYFLYKMGLLKILKKLK